MKAALHRYYTMGMITKPADGVDYADRKLMVNYLYHISFYIDEIYRSFRCIEDERFFQPELYGGSDKGKKIQYYHHHTWNLLNYTGMLVDSVRNINKIDSCKGVLEFDFDKDKRNLLAHIFEKMSVLNEVTGRLHGFNVIFDEEDFHLRDIIEPVFNLDLLTKEITMITIDRVGDVTTENIHHHKIKLEEIKEKIDSFNVQVKGINEYIEQAWKKEIM